MYIMQKLDGCQVRGDGRKLDPENTITLQVNLKIQRRGLCRNMLSLLVCIAFYNVWNGR